MVSILRWSMVIFKSAIATQSINFAQQKDGNNEIPLKFKNYYQICF